MVADGKVMLKTIVKSSHYMKNSIHRHTPSQKRDVSHMLSLITKKWESTPTPLFTHQREMHPIQHASQMMNWQKQKSKDGAVLRLMALLT
jgi:hypothetical protein